MGGSNGGHLPPETGKIRGTSRNDPKLTTGQLFFNEINPNFRGWSVLAYFKKLSQKIREKSINGKNIAENAYLRVP